jgi:hypothetical protein
MPRRNYSKIRPSETLHDPVEMPLDSQRFVDVLIGQRVYTAAKWIPQENAVYIFSGRADPITMPFAYVKRWRPRENRWDMGRERWRNGPFRHIEAHR